MSFNVSVEFCQRTTKKSSRPAAKPPSPVSPLVVRNFERLRLVLRRKRADPLLVLWWYCCTFHLSFHSRLRSWKLLLCRLSFSLSCRDLLRAPSSLEDGLLLPWQTLRAGRSWALHCLVASYGPNSSSSCRSPMLRSLSDGSVGITAMTLRGVDSVSPSVEVPRGSLSSKLPRSLTSGHGFPASPLAGDPAGRR